MWETEWDAEGYNESGIRKMYSLGIKVGSEVSTKGKAKTTFCPYKEEKCETGCKDCEVEPMTEDDMTERLLDRHPGFVEQRAHEQGIPTWQAAEEIVEDLVMQKMTIDDLEEQLNKESWATVVSKGTAKKVKRTQKRETLKALGIVEPTPVCAVATGEWEEIEMAVDSGASESVTNEGELKSVKVTEGDAKKRGVMYEVADGTLIPNLGEKDFIAVGESGSMRQMKLQVCDVNKSLLSVRRITQAGNRVVLEDGSGYIEDLTTGEKMWLAEKEGMYVLKMWVKRGGGMPTQGFMRQE